MTYLIVIVLVLLSGLFSGLTLGLLSLDINELKRKITLGNQQAKKVYKVRRKGNLLLCTLLLGNVAVNSTLAIFLGDVASGFVAGILATGLIVVFGEIIPQATFSRYALAVGAKTVWLVRIFIILFFPITWPLSFMLDKVLGEEMPTIYSRTELMKIVEEHEGSNKSDIDADEERIIKGALSYSNKTTGEIMTPRTVVFALEAGELLSARMLNKIKQEGFTRVPVYQESVDNVIGILYAKDLINIKHGLRIKDVIKKKNILTVNKEEKLDILMNRFITSHNHMAFIKDEYNGLEGVVTLEDVVEEILRQEIMDETDKVPDLQQEAKDKNKQKK